MTILLAPDKFKGALSAAAVCAALAAGIRAVQPDVRLILKPLADGGDGSLAVLRHYEKLERVEKRVSDPLGRSITAHYYRAGHRAYVELAVASGLASLAQTERHCATASAYGTGELIADALTRGAIEIYLFIGGSATNDAGTGIAAALGYRFLDATGRPVQPVGKYLERITHIDATHRCFNPADVRFQVICDVDNPFHGPLGAARVYAPQKGADPATVAALDRGLAHFARVLVAQGYPNVAHLPGAGAAGGIGGGAVALLGAELRSGFTVFEELTQLEAAVANSGLVITGEGKLDAQTARGKVVSGVCALARRHRKPVIAVCGDAERPADSRLGLRALYTVRERSASITEAMGDAAAKLELIGREMGREGLP